MPHDASADPHTAASPAKQPTPDLARRPTWRSPAAWAWLLVFAMLGLVTDLASKYISFAKIADAPVEVRRAEVIAADRPGDVLPPHDPITVLPHLLEFELVLNPGAVFGIGAGKRWFFVGFTAVALIFGLLLFARWTGPKQRAAHAAIGLIIAGGLGNLYDRVQYACVRDFIHPLPGVRLPFGWSWPWGGDEVWPYVSNLADLWLIIGVVILMGYSLKAPKPPTTPQPAASK